MKKTVFQIAVAVMVLIMGCSKDELIDEASENQLKKGSIASPPVSSLSFYGKSIEGAYFTLDELNDGSKIMRNGKCSGNISGKINTALSTYTFNTCTAQPKLNPGDDGRRWFDLPTQYILFGRGKVCINLVDYFEFEITEGLYIPGNSYPNAVQPGIYKGAIFISNNNGEGSAKVTFASGKFKAFAGKPLQVYRAFDYTSIERLSGKIDLYFECRL